MQHGVEWVCMRGGVLGVAAATTLARAPNVQPARRQLREFIQARLLEGMGTGRVAMTPMRRCGRDWHRQCWSASSSVDESSEFPFLRTQRPKRWSRSSRRPFREC